jgi:hypothetical protein
MEKERAARISPRTLLIYVRHKTDGLLFDRQLTSADGRRSVVETAAVNQATKIIFVRSKDNRIIDVACRGVPWMALA